EELLRVDRHLESCEACRQGLARDPDPRLSTAGLREALLGDEDLSAAHPAYEELAAYVDGELAGAEREAPAAHLQGCEARRPAGPAPPGPRSRGAPRALGGRRGRWGGGRGGWR